MPSRHVEGAAVSAAGTVLYLAAGYEARRWPLLTIFFADSSVFTAGIGVCHFRRWRNTRTARYATED